MEGANFDGYYDHSTKAREMIQNNGCFWLPIIGWICPGGSNNSDDD
jgi:predicted oxidoreductase